MIQEIFESLNDNKSKNAFFINERYYTYGQLMELTGNIRLALENKGGSLSKKIGIVTTNTIETYASILAVWFSGFGYVPIDRNNPPKRNSFIVKEAEIDLVLNTDDNISAVFENPAEINFITTQNLPIETGVDQAPVVQVNGNLAYILFTSGSTGVPKGVPISFGNLESFLDSFFELDISIDSSDRCLQMFDLSFDVSIASYLIPLLKGACVYTVPSGGVKYLHIFKALRNDKITYASIAPSVLNFLKPYFHEIDLPHLKTCILTAEASNLNLIRQWQPLMKNGKIINLYGPTEATIWCTGLVYNVEKAKSYNEMLAIGKPFKNVKGVILDEEGKEADVDRKGELCISGNQLTIGYLNNPEKDKLAFIWREGQRFYKTGDLCFRDSEGDIIYCGRIDYQVKIQGYRVELSEIEVVVRQYCGVNCVAMVYSNKHGGNEICVFIENYTGNSNSILKELQAKLPYYMIPSKIHIVQTFPINSSGKTDRIALLNSIQEVTSVANTK